MHWLIHFFGIDTQQSWAYDYWSGVATQLPIPNWIIAFIWYRKHHCHQRRCWRIGRHSQDGTPWCGRHLRAPEPPACACPRH